MYFPLKATAPSFCLKVNVKYNYCVLVFLCLLFNKVCLADLPLAFAHLLLLEEKCRLLIQSRGKALEKEAYEILIFDFFLTFYLIFLIFSLIFFNKVYVIFFSALPLGCNGRCYQNAEGTDSRHFYHVYR